MARLDHGGVFPCHNARDFHHNIYISIVGKSKLLEKSSLLGSSVRFSFKNTQREPHVNSKYKTIVK